MKRLLIVMLFALSACGSAEEAAITTKFTDAPNSLAVTATRDGGVIYGDDGTGDIWTVNADGKRNTTPTARVPISGAEGGGLQGLLVDDQGRIFVSYIAQDLALTVARIEDGRGITIWTGPTATLAALRSNHVGGQLLMTEGDRILTALGDFGDSAKARDEEESVGKIITLNPTGRETQRPNLIASGFSSPTAITFDQGGSLWVAEGDQNVNVRVFRVSMSGERGPETDTGSRGPATGLTSYSEQELVACFDDNSALQRLLIQDATSAVPGRLLANDCVGGVTQVADGRLVYARGNELGATS